MKSLRLHRIALLLGAVLVCALPFANMAEARTQRLVLAGGPLGGTFEPMAKALIPRLNASLTGAEVTYSISAGSVENLRRLHTGQADLAIVNLSDFVLAHQGRLPFDARAYTNVLSLARLYGAPAQLLVAERGPINSVADLAGKRLAVGGAGSGAAATAQRYFNSLGMWDKIKPEYIGYTQAVSALAHGYIDAAWVMAGAPTEAVRQAAESYPIRLINLLEEARKANFFDDYPFFQPASLPAGLYPGVAGEVATFQDVAILVSGAHVSEEMVRAVLKGLLSGPPGVTLPHFDPSRAGEGLPQPLHPGAKRFWDQQ